MWNWFSALGRAGVLTQAQVKHVLVKLRKRLSCLSGKLSPSVVLLQTVSILWCLVHTLCPPSLSLSRSPSFVLLPTPPPSLYSTSAHSRVELSWPGPSANRDSNGFNKNTVWGMRIEFHTWVLRHYMCFFLIKKEEQERGEQSRATRPEEDRLRLFSFLLTFLLP